MLILLGKDENTGQEPGTVCRAEMPVSCVHQLRPRRVWKMTAAELPSEVSKRRFTEKSGLMAAPRMERVWMESVGDIFGMRYTK